MEKYSFDEIRQSVLESMQIPLAVYKFVDDRITTVIISDGFCRMFGYTDRKQACYDLDNDMYFALHPDDRARVEEADRRFTVEGGDYEVIYRTKKKTGSAYFVVHAFGKHFTTQDNVRLAYVWYVDEGEYREDEHLRESKLNTILSNALHEESILKAHRVDALTGLASMTHFFDLVEVYRERSIKDGGKPALLYFDICGLKYYNHKYGFEQGNLLIRSFSKLLADTFGGDMCSHIGQGHFAVFSSVVGVEEKLKDLFAKHKAQAKDAPPVRAGIFSDSEQDVAPVSVACDRAKLACDSQKNIAESRFCYYSQELKDEMIRKQFIFENFDKALENRHIVPYFQPIVRAMNGKVCDEEALARWIDPEKGVLSPAEFIPFLEESKLIYKLDLYLLERVLEKMQREKEIGMTVVPHSINLSRSDFVQCDIVEEICKRVDAAGIERSKISLEITESVIGGNFDFMKEQISRFRKLGFPVWMDDFGSAYSSLDLLQSIEFDLIKFDMGFMKKLDEGENGRVILAELMKMANVLGLDTVCEGVETAEQMRFLREIGCSKLQGFYYCQPISFEALIERYEKGEQIGFENPDEDEYYKAVGGINLNDLSVIMGDDVESVHNSFESIPMGVIEVRGDKARFVRSNKSYRDFLKRSFGFNLAQEGSTFEKYNDSFMYNVVEICCKRGLRSFYDDAMPDGSVVHSFARRIGVNPINGNTAVAVAVLSITEPNEGTTYAGIARALAADYYNIYYVDLETDRFIEYTSPVGGEVIAMERHGENFFEECRTAAYRIYEEDRESFFAAFSKEQVIKALDDHGVYMANYRLTDTGTPMAVNMKITRMQPHSNRIIMGISIIDPHAAQDPTHEK